jgi:hypothetical protein
MNNTLIIADTHLPFTKVSYLPFLRHIHHKYGCNRVVHIGDLVDNHSISFHDHDPNGLSPEEELKAARKELSRYVKAFPKADCCIGNHDELGRRKAFANGIPTQYIRSFNEVFDLPRSWKFAFEHRYGNWRAIHGTGGSGHDNAFKQAVSGRISTAAGHIHTAAGVKYHASSKDIIWGMQVGCALAHKSYAFSYGRDFKDKPILGCGVVLENGTLPLFIPMSL